MFTAIVILLIPITFFVGGLYQEWFSDMLSPDLQYATYARGLLNLAITLVTVLVSVSLFRRFKNRLLPALKSELVILSILWALSLVILMNPFVIAGIDSLMWLLSWSDRPIRP